MTADETGNNLIEISLYNPAFDAAFLTKGMRTCEVLPGKYE
jgi:hypothetical protein